LLFQVILFLAFLKLKELAGAGALIEAIGDPKLQAL